MLLVELEGCVFDADQLRGAHGYVGLDPVAQEAFVNHIHISGPGRSARATALIESWASQLRARWPGASFRIYREVTRNEITVRFHRLRAESPNWAEEGVEIIEVRT